jgi:hypothetical protein
MLSSFRRSALAGKIPFPARGRAGKEIFTMTIEEQQKLDEMAIAVINSPKDNLSFRVAIKLPDRQPPHAHIMDKATGKKELGQFLIDEKPPEKPEDIKDYKQGITNDMRQEIVAWAKLRNKDLPKVTNWEQLVWQWLRNEMK